MQRVLQKIKIGLALTLSGALLACSSGGGGEASLNTSLTSIQKDFVENYADIVLASYEDSVVEATRLQDAVDLFLNDPTPASYEEVKAAWLRSREPYGQTEVYRFYEGSPIEATEIYINSWPLDESYIDYVEGAENAGIINHTDLAINEEYLLEPSKDLEDNVNSVPDDAIKTGYHAIEFLLWGQDLNETPASVGNRSYTDYLTVGGTHENQIRRRDYLALASQILVTQLTQVKSQWVANIPGNYRSQFLSANPKEAIRRIMVGLGKLGGGELATERMENALLHKDQEEEHSCFSDNTHRDLVENLQGLINVYNGTYKRIDGTRVGNGVGFKDLVQSVDPSLNSQIKNQLDVAQSIILEISRLAEEDNIHFDQQIQGDDSSPNRVRIQTAIDALYAFQDSISEAASILNININFVD